MKYFANILEMIGSTPLLRLNHVTDGIQATVLAKMESRNPGGSVKDRIGIAMVEAAEREGRLQPGGLIIEPTSGNTGIGLALAAKIKGYRCLFIMTEKASTERVRYLRAMGADVMIVPSAAKSSSPEYYFNTAKRLAEELPNAIMLNQYDNPSNPDVHYRTTGPEIWNDTDGKVTHFIAGMGTGGTISGTAKYLKEKNPNIKIIAADPLGSSIKSFKDTGRLVESLPYLVEGVGQERIPGNLALPLVDEVLNITDKESFVMARRLAREEGIFCGGSSGMNVVAALRVAKLLPKDAVVVAIICDTGERYLTKHHSDDWLKQNNMIDVDRMTLKMLLEEKHSSKTLPPLVSVKTSSLIKECLDLMNKYEISSLPVLDEAGKPAGSVRDNRLMAKVLEDRNALDASISDVMEESMPVLDAQTDVKEAIERLRQSPSILVGDFGRIIGIVSRHDVLRYA
ncbi:MAG: cysteine synthase [Candidatus Kapabacteria bacterium]|jgi:cystathionine beta-synthase|nr:cysteine synthase [Candidatus Kapabacteria bacterium]